MKVEDVLRQKKAAILEKWFQLLLDTYPAETSRFLKEEKNQFANPVGHAFYQGIEGLYEGLLQGLEPEKISPFIDKIVRIRAVQDFLPSQANAYIFLLKRAIREELAAELRENRVPIKELLTFESRIDELALHSFDIYMKCREKIYEIRVNEVKNRTAKLLERANLVLNLP
ncbi:MAG: hypothetical protein PWP65_780 [Clostridia bacterium]|nr:hypothetical protein [Clostridia bacterium]